MSIFKDHKIGVSQLLEFIPEALLSHLSEHTKIDYYFKVLHCGGKAVKYTMSFDGILPCSSEIFTTQGYSSQDNALPEALRIMLNKKRGIKIYMY